MVTVWSQRSTKYLILCRKKASHAGLEQHEGEQIITDFFFLFLG